MRLLERVKRSAFLRAAILSFLIPLIPCAAGEKRILLRNETIVTGATAQRDLPNQALNGKAKTAGEKGDGLFLIQLEDNPPVDWKQRLENLRATVLRSVPEDAFVADLAEANIAEIRALPFVHWVGSYLPEHKTHERILKLAAATNDTRVRVSALLSPAARGIDTARLQRLFSSLSKYDKTSVGRVLQGEISTRKLNQLIQSRLVLWIEPAPQPKLQDGLAVQIIGGEGNAGGASVAVHELGFTGKGVKVAVADSGLDLGEGEPMHPDLAGRVDGFFYYGNLTDASDEHSHGTHVTGIIAGNGAGGETDESGYLYGLGVAPESHIIVQRIFDGAGDFEAPASNAQLTSDAVRAGADIGSNSWGDDVQGRYDTSAMEFDALVRDADPDTPGDQPYILEFSAGNAGPGAKTIDSPAVAKNVIATGASQNDRFDFFIYADGRESMADFSSRGPCEDGRIKPDLVAPGTWIASLQSGAASDENAWLPISALYQYEGGTSQAGPHVAGAAAVFVQYYRDKHGGQSPSPALVKAALINSAADMDNTVSPGSGGTTFAPNNDEGWGRVDLENLIASERHYDFTDQSTLLTNSQVFEKHLVLASFNQPLAVTLAYTDVPGFPPAIPALVNDLDLEVISPSGIVYRGNQFEDGESVPNAGSFDSINNVEGVRVAFPEPGEYLVRVIARKVIEDSRKDTPAADQDFALVFSGDIPLPGQGVVGMDRRAYTVPDTIQLKLIDLDLAQQPTASVTLSSDSQPDGFAVTLEANGSSGVFTGAVQTASLPVANDGRLHIAQDDAIEVSYNDASMGNIIRANARADLLPPVISATTATNHFGKELITWTTDEPARSIVYYGTNEAKLGITNSALVTEHEVLLPNLTAGTTYQFYVISTDEAGNRAVSNNNGANYTFKASPAATVLLVNAYEDDPNAQSPDIPVTSYTDALDQTGFSYEVWDVAEDGSPTDADLAPFRVVIWRINDSFWVADNTLTEAQQTAITNYLANGGSFLLSSMEILTRLGDVPFRTNVLQAAEFTQPPSPLETCSDCDEDHGAANVTGSPFDPLTSSFSVEMDYSLYPVYVQEPVAPNVGPDVSDTFTPTTNSLPILFEDSGGVVGIKYPRTGQAARGRVVFLSVPLDGIPLNAPAPNNRVTLLRNLLTFLAPGVNGLGTVSLDNRSYTVPSRVIVEVADADLMGQTSLTVSVAASPSGKSTTLELQPTVRPGVFQGFLTLISSNDSPAPGRLPVADGDVIKVTYSDASSTRQVQASAAIDLGFPHILNQSIQADFETADISWDTSEPADSLIQFGESAFLGKTAYSSKLAESRTLTIGPLAPDHVYYYQIASRDASGNTTIDDNNGKLYTFRTLKPLVPPWFDDMETGAADWGVQNGEDVESSWTLGTPNNGLATEAHSGTNCWGSNLNGSGATYIESYLVSPAVELKGGNLATLKFWHNYDFSIDATYQLAQLLLFTNSQTLPVTLATYDDASPGWVQAEFDLTPYIGKVIHLAWDHELLDISDLSTVQPGWLVDDVEITVTNVVYGTIRVTNNIAAAAFSVSGPTSFEGSGHSMVRSNAFAGDYVVTFDPVPYYNTPPPQTNTLTSEAPMIISGNYTFDDANQNGIPDSWEQENFGEISATRTATTDSDSDGMSDLAEFIAGTNPLDPGSNFQIGLASVLAGNRVELAWNSEEGKVYQVFGSKDGESWIPYGPPLRASGPQTSYTSPSNGSEVYFFKVQVVP